MTAETLTALPASKVAAYVDSMTKAEAADLLNELRAMAKEGISVDDLIPVLEARLFAAHETMTDKGQTLLFGPRWPGETR